MTNELNYFCGCSYLKPGFTIVQYEPPLENCHHSYDLTSFYDTPLLHLFLHNTTQIWNHRMQVTHVVLTHLKEEQAISFLQKRFFVFSSAHNNSLNFLSSPPFNI